MRMFTMYLNMLLAFIVFRTITLYVLEPYICCELKVLLQVAITQTLLDLISIICEEMEYE
jgi:hypothetical protein